MDYVLDVVKYIKAESYTVSVYITEAGYFVTEPQQVIGTEGISQLLLQPREIGVVEIRRTS